MHFKFSQSGLISFARYNSNLGLVSIILGNKARANPVSVWLVLTYATFFHLCQTDPYCLSYHSSCIRYLPGICTLNIYKNSNDSTGWWKLIFDIELRGNHRKNPQRLDLYHNSLLKFVGYICSFLWLSVYPYLLSCWKAWGNTFWTYMSNTVLRFWNISIHWAHQNNSTVLSN